MNEIVPLPDVPTRAQIERLEGAMREFPALDIQTRHYFANGLYAREITIPKGCLLTGKVHKHEHLNIVSQGDITVWTEKGMKRIQAPCTLVSLPGTKRVGFAHEETVWTTIHANPTGESNPEALELLLVEPDRPLLEEPAACLS
jgi:hypothetical protein